MKITRSSAALSLVLVAGLGLAACSDDKPVPPKDGQGKTTTQEKGKDKKATSAELTSKNFSQRMGDAQNKAGSAHMDMTMETAGVKMPMSADMVLPKNDDPNSIKMKMTMDLSAAGAAAGGDSAGAPTKMDMIMIGTKEIYMNMGALTQNKYAKIPESQLGSMNLDQSLNNSDPAKQAEQMAKYLKDFKVVGTEEIDGVKTTQYDVKVDSKMALEGAGEGASAAKDALGDEMTYSMWIGPDDLPRKMTMDMGSAGKAEMTFSKWGEDLNIEAPSASEITELPGGSGF